MGPAAAEDALELALLREAQLAQLEADREKAKLPPFDPAVPRASPEVPTATVQPPAVKPKPKPPAEPEVASLADARPAETFSLIGDVAGTLASAVSSAVNSAATSSFTSAAAPSEPDDEEAEAPQEEPEKLRGRRKERHLSLLERHLSLLERLRGESGDDEPEEDAASAPANRTAPARPLLARVLGAWRDEQQSFPACTDSRAGPVAEPTPRPSRDAAPEETSAREETPGGASEEHPDLEAGAVPRWRVIRDALERGSAEPVQEAPVRGELEKPEKPEVEVEPPAAAHTAVRPEERSPAEAPTPVTAASPAPDLRAVFERLWGRPPARAEATGFRPLNYRHSFGSVSGRWGGPTGGLEDPE
jgi:hypothetical protein